MTDKEKAEFKVNSEFLIWDLQHPNASDRERREALQVLQVLYGPGAGRSFGDIREQVRQQAEKISVVLNMQELYQSGYKGHPLVWVRDLGIAFETAQCFSIPCIWLLSGVDPTTLPDPLPSWLEVRDQGGK